MNSGNLMKTFIGLLMLYCLSANAQSSTKNLYELLTGSWVKTKVSWVDSNRKEALADYHQSYLKYEFTDAHDLLVFGSYVANGVKVKHELKGKKLSFGLGRNFIIEAVDEERLVMAELVGGASGKPGIRFEFVKEQLYIDALPINRDDFIVEASGDTLFFDSEKFHPRFRHKQYPDFHLYVHNQIKRYYPGGENYFYASFEIDEHGVIDMVQVFASPNRKTAEKAVAVIKKSGGNWSLPMLNGEGVKVLVCVEDRYNKGKREASVNQRDITQRYSESFVRSHQKAVGRYVRKQYDQMTEWLDWCEKMNPEEPTFLYLKYLYSQAVKDAEAVAKYQNQISNTPLRFLIK